MKKEILMLIIGILIGAIISTGIFLVLQGNQKSFENMGEPPSAMNENMLDGERKMERPDEESDTTQENEENSSTSNS